MVSEKNPMYQTNSYIDENIVKRIMYSPIQGDKPFNIPNEDVRRSANVLIVGPLGGSKLIASLLAESPYFNVVLSSDHDSNTSNADIVYRIKDSSITPVQAAEYIQLMASRKANEKENEHEHNVDRNNFPLLKPALKQGPSFIPRSQGGRTLRLEDSLTH